MRDELKLLFSGDYVPPKLAIPAGRNLLLQAGPIAALLATVFVLGRPNIVAIALGWLAVPFWAISTVGIMAYVGEGVYLRELRDWQPQTSTARAQFAGKVAGLLFLAALFAYVDVLVKK